MSLIHFKIKHETARDCQLHVAHPFVMLLRTSQNIMYINFVFGRYFPPLVSHFRSAGQCCVVSPVGVVLHTCLYFINKIYLGMFKIMLDLLSLVL